MEFNPINTQEEFDACVTELYGDVSGLQGEINTHKATIAERDQTISGLQAKVKGYETSALKQRIAREKGIPPEMADRLSGETEKDIKADADAVAGILKAIKGPAPLHEPEPPVPDAKTAALKKMLHDMKGE